jgi:DNA-binding beta-propeller fold protein YncE
MMLLSYQEYNVLLAGKAHTDAKGDFAMSVDLRSMILALLAGCLLAGCGAPSSTASPPPPSATPSAPSPAPTQGATPTSLPEPLPPLQPITAENAESVRLLRTMEIPGYRGGMIAQCSVAFSPDGRLLVGACGMARVPVWEVESGLLRYRLYETPQQIVACSFAPDGETLATGGFDNSVTLWDPETGEGTGSLGPYDSPVWDIAFSPEGHSLAAASFGMGSGGGDLRLSDILDGEPIWDYAGSGMFLSVSAHPSGEILAYGDARGGIGLLDAAAGDLTLSLDQGRQPVGDIAYSRTGALLAAGSDDHNIYLWNTSDYQLIAALEGHRHYVNGVAFSPDERLLVSGSHDQTLRIWDLSTYQSLASLEGHDDVILRVAFNPDGTLIASVSWDGTVRLWGVPAE